MPVIASLVRDDFCYLTTEAQSHRETLFKLDLLSVSVPPLALARQGKCVVLFAKNQELTSDLGHTTSIWGLALVQEVLAGLVVHGLLEQRQNRLAAADGIQKVNFPIIH